MEQQTTTFRNTQMFMGFSMVFNHQIGWWLNMASYWVLKPITIPKSQFHRNIMGIQWLFLYEIAYAHGNILDLMEYPHMRVYIYIYTCIYVCNIWIFTNIRTLIYIYIYIYIYIDRLDIMGTSWDYYLAV